MYKYVCGHAGMSTDDAVLSISTIAALSLASRLALQLLSHSGMGVGGGLKSTVGLS